MANSARAFANTNLLSMKPFNVSFPTNRFVLSNELEEIGNENPY